MENKVNYKIMSMAGQGGSIFGISLLELIKDIDSLMVLSSDMSTPSGLDKFKTAHPKHFMNMGIAEQNMVGTAAGLVQEGFKCVCVAQACFLTMRSFEQIRQYCGYMKLPLVLVGIGSGLSLQYMGNTHYALEDIALMRTIPGMQVIAPCDAYEACNAFKEVLQSNQPTYIRLFGGTGVTPVHTSEYDFTIGKSIKVKSGQDIQIIATGSMVSVSILVADALEEKGISAEVVDMHTIKPLDTNAINTDCKNVFTIEEHFITGGLGDAVASYLAEKGNPCKLHRIGVNDSFSAVGDYSYLLSENNLSKDKIINLITNKL